MVYISWPVGSITQPSIDEFRSGLSKLVRQDSDGGGYSSINKMDDPLNLYIFYSSSDGKNRFNVFDNEEQAEFEMKRMKEDSSVELPELNQDVLVGRFRTMFNSEFDEHDPILEKLQVFLPKIQDNKHFSVTVAEFKDALNSINTYCLSKGKKPRVSHQTDDHCKSIIGKNVGSHQKNDANTLLDKGVSDETDNGVDNFTQRSKILIPVLGMLALVPCLLFALVVTVTFLPIVSLSIIIYLCRYKFCQQNE